MRTLAAGILLAVALPACERRPPTPVAPFGERLATTLPWRDVIGLVRLCPDAGGLAPLLGTAIEELPAAARRTLAGPPVTMLDLATTGGFLAPGEPLAVVLLDPSVHGALCGFAWRGGAAPFVTAARTAGLRSDGARIWLPGRGRVDGLSAVVRDIAANTIALHRYDGGNDRPRGSAVLPEVRYELVERDGLTLLLPARDGVARVLDTLNATGLLDRATGDGLVVRFEFGAAAAEMKNELRDQLNMFASSSVWQYAMGREEDGDVDWGAATRLYRQMLDPLQEVIRGTIEALVSIDHVFVVERAGTLEWFVRAEPGKFFADALTVLRNRPLGELLTGAPDEAKVLLAASVDPAVLQEVPAMLRRAQEAAGGGGRHRRRALHSAIERAVEAESRRKDAVAEGSDEPPFLEVFGGRFWIAGGPPPERVTAPSLLDLLNFGRKPDEAAPAPVELAGDGDGGAAATVAGAGAGGSDPADESTSDWCARLFTELPRDDGNHGLLESLLSFALEPEAMGIVRGAVAPTNLWSVQRVGGGLVEAVGREASGIAAADRQRLERDRESTPTLPAGGPAGACAALRLALADGPGNWWCIEAAADGLRLRQIAASR
ncbi:MAG: hypothetical protein FJ293_01485 [Planctomycetes bacterium]|nr:hypothetical protein [Planctomycetota bacterium]